MNKFTLSISYRKATYIVEVSAEECTVMVKYPFEEDYVSVESLPHQVVCEALRKLAAQIPSNNG